jgi:two-component system chemotaxis sensor kinase CheA
MGLPNLSSLTHQAESLLSSIRGGEIALAPIHLELFLETLDLIHSFLDFIQKNFHDRTLEEKKQALEKRLAQVLAAGPSAILDQNPTETQEKRPPPMIFLDDPPRYPDANQTSRNQFLKEGQETLDRLESLLLKIERKPGNPEELLRECLRKAHELKTTSGIMGFSVMEQLCGKTEAILERYQDLNSIPGSSEIMCCLMVTDSLRHGLQDIAKGGTGIIDDKEMVMRFLGDVARDLPTAPEKPPARLGAILVNSGKVAPELVHQALDLQEAPLGKILVDLGAASQETINEALKTQGESTGKNAAIKKRTDIRVDLRILDGLVNLIGELIIAESMVTRNPDLRGLELPNFDRSVHVLRRITNELQDIALNVRMVPLSSTFQRLHRIVHDVSKKIGKSAQLELIGEETEVDKTITEQLMDPLVHMVRNSIDHGLEPPEERLRLGKSEVGKIAIEARHESGEVWILISDDGRGLDRDKILAVAAEKGLLKGNPETLKDEEAFKFIFDPGFSTSTEISEISGRGVGMDVVKKNLEKIRGKISLSSKKGQGTTVRLQIPLTMAIIDGMVIRVGETRFTIPLLAIRESVRPAVEMIKVTPDGQELVRIRKDYLPVVRLNRLFRKNEGILELPQGILIVVEDSHLRVALFADEIIGQQQIVVKALSSYFGNPPGITGCSILGDGSVSLILDVGGIFQKAGVTNMKTEI